MKNFIIFTVISLLFTVPLWAKGPNRFDDGIHSFHPGAKPVLGVLVKDADEDTLKEMNLKGGAEIVAILKKSEADRIGLQEKDIIVRFDERRILSAEDLRDFIRDLDQTKDVQITVIRNGKELTFIAHLVPVKNKRMRVKIHKGDGDLDVEIEKLIPPAVPPFPMELPTDKGGFLGVEAKDISDQLKAYFQVEYGVLIEKVLEDSPAEQAGLQAGDVIQKINGKKIEDFSDLRRVLNYYDPGDQINIQYSRKGKVKEVKVILGEKKVKKIHRRMHIRPDLKNFYQNWRPDLLWLWMHEGAKDENLEKLLKEKTLNWFII